MSEIAVDPVTLTLQDDVARITLNRPERHNAFDGVLIAQITNFLEQIATTPDIRVVVLAATGKSFCAGGDLDWMRRCATFTPAENTEDARQLGHMMACLDRLNKPTVALVQGAAYGGGVGLVAACDIALASDSARFCLSEVKLGLIPSVISPYVVDAIGARAARRYFLTAESFGTAEAHRLGLVHDVVPGDELEAAGARMTEALLANGPQAVAAAKRLIADVTGAERDDALIEKTARGIADIRATDEAKEGISAFFDRRPPRWNKP
jgi:methylglutaconyl-CoA hydratase